MSKNTPYPNIYKDALTIQDASNTIGVVNAFARMQRAIQMNNGDNSVAFREHPVTVLMVNKLASMVPGAADELPNDMTILNRAYDECKAKSTLPHCTQCGLVETQERLDAHRHEAVPDHDDSMLVFYLDAGNREQQKLVFTD